ncbi:MAG: serine/threonine-protein kinase [Planctomycetota bacterium]
MAPGSGRDKSAHPQRRVCVACARCGQGYRISARLLGRRLVCRHCHNEWRAKEIDPGEFRSGRLLGERVSSDSGKQGLPESLPPRAGSSSVSIDMSWAGRELGRYRVLSLLGHGGMGSVWRSHDASLRRDVALKILNSTKGNGGAPGGLNAELFMQEARAVAKLQHPSVVSIYEVVEDDGQVFLALELMEGGTLKEYVERYGRIPPRELFRMMIGPTRALALAHRSQIIHRDIKPGNLMFDDHGHLKLMDFGLADVAQEAASEKMRGKAVGSLGWIAPETARGQGTTASSDIYGMGLVLLYGLTGRPWLHSKSRSELIAMHQNPPNLDLSDIKGLTPRAEAVIRRCLAVEQADRFVTADQIAEELQACADEDPDRILRQRKNYASIAVAAGLFGAVVSALMVLYYFSDLSERERQYRGPVRVEEGAPGAGRYEELRPPEAEEGPSSEGAEAERIEAPPGADAAPEARPSDEPVNLEDAKGPWTDYPHLFDPSTFEFVGSQNGRVFHTQEGRCGRGIHAQNLVTYKSYEEAIAAGRKPCQQCKPQKETSGDGVKF